MKRFWSLVPFILACCLLIGAIGFGIFMIIFCSVRKKHKKRASFWTLFHFHI